MLKYGFNVSNFSYLFLLNAISYLIFMLKSSIYFLVIGVVSFIDFFVPESDEFSECIEESGMVIDGYV